MYNSDSQGIFIVSIQKISNSFMIVVELFIFFWPDFHLFSFCSYYCILYCVEAARERAVIYLDPVNVSQHNI